MKKVNKYFISTKLFLIIFFLSACDFTPRIHKKILLAQHYVQNQEYEQAIQEYESLLKDTHSKEIEVKVNYQLGELYSINLGKNERSLDFYRAVKEITEDPLWLVKAEERMGEINFSYLKNYNRAIESYSKLKAFTPRLEKYDFYDFRLALSYFYKTDYKESIEILRKINLNSQHEYHIRSFYYLGMVYFQQKNWEEAINSWKTYIKKEKRRDNIVQTKFLMANAYETMEDLKQAYNLYYSILGEYPNKEVIKNRLNAVYERRIARKR